jgi:hypothetical protein
VSSDGILTPAAEWDQRLSDGPTDPFEMRWYREAWQASHRTVTSDVATSSNRWRGGQPISACCGAAGVGTGLAAIVAAQGGALHPSELVHISNQDLIAGYAASADPHFQFVTLYQHYDGSYYYAVARDPFLLGKAHTLIDQPAYRYGHPLHGWLAGLLSLGQARLVPLALLLLSLIGLAVGGWAASRLAVHFGRTPWAGLVVAVSPGVLFAATADTTETVGVALLALTFLAWLHRRYGWTVLLIVALCLDKEQYVTVPLGLGIWELIEARRRRTTIESPTVKVAAILTGPIVLAGWYGFVHARLHAWPWTYESGNFGKPFAGWRETFRLAHSLSGSTFAGSEIGGMTPVVLVATAGLLIIAAVVALRLRSIFDATLLGMVAITSMQGWRTLLYPREVFRTPAVVLLFALAVLLLRSPPSQSQPATSADAAGIVH